eukprot:3143561-Amphidinium_carterae.1
MKHSIRRTEHLKSLAKRVNHHPPNAGTNVEILQHAIARETCLNLRKHAALVLVCISMPV